MFFLFPSYWPQVDIQELVEEYRRTGREITSIKAATPAALQPQPKKPKLAAAASKLGGGEAGLRLEAAPATQAAEVKREEGDGGAAPPHAATAGKQPAAAGRKHRAEDSAALQQRGEAPPEGAVHQTQGTFALRPAAAGGEASPFVVAVTPGGGGDPSKASSCAAGTCPRRRLQTLHARSAPSVPGVPAAPSHLAGCPRRRSLLPLRHSRQGTTSNAMSLSQSGMRRPRPSSPSWQTSGG